MYMHIYCYKGDYTFDITLNRILTYAVLPNISLNRLLTTQMFVSYGRCKS
jgi:hypothetical protein